MTPGGMTHIAFATDARHRELTLDDRLAADHLGARGIRVSPACWDDPVEWQAFDAIVIRSCWDYHLRLEEFTAWLDRLDRLGCTVQNPTATLRWNSRKTYLETLRSAGLEVIPTLFLPRGSEASLGALMDRLAADELVLKPTVGASAYGLWTASRGRDEQQGRLDAMLAEHEVMAQPLIREVVTRGEWSLVYFGGQFSHAVNKRPRAGDIRVQEELGGVITPAEPPGALRDAAGRILAWLEEDLLYARVDMVEVGGRGLLMELELVEPGLYFHADRGSPERFGDALLRGSEVA